MAACCWPSSARAPPPQEANLAVRGLGICIENGSTSTSADNNTFFGTVKPGAEVAHDFELESTGEVTLVISGHAPVGSCKYNFRPGSIPSSLTGGNTGMARVYFDAVGRDRSSRTRRSVNRAGSIVGFGLWPIPTYPE